VETTQAIDDFFEQFMASMRELRKSQEETAWQMKETDKRKYLGAMAGVVFSETEKIYALKKGFYVIEPSGETFKITEPKGVYRPHAW
jgi:membrane-associated HD superfamily phosphohydrolase